MHSGPSVVYSTVAAVGSSDMNASSSVIVKQHVTVRTLTNSLSRGVTSLKHVQLKTEVINLSTTL